MNFHMPKDALRRFCQNKYVKPTRPNAGISYQSDHDIHIQFEIKLDPSFAKSSSEPVKLLSIHEATQEKRKAHKKKKSDSKHKFKLE